MGGGRSRWGVDGSHARGEGGELKNTVPLKTSWAIWTSTEQQGRLPGERLPTSSILYVPFFFYAIYHKYIKGAGQQGTSDLY